MIHESGWVRIQHRSWMPSLESVWRNRDGDLTRRSRRHIRPWRSPAARRRWEEEEVGSWERRSRRRGWGHQRTDVTKGDKEEELVVVVVVEEEEEDGGGRGRTEISCMEGESSTATLLPAA